MAHSGNLERLGVGNSDTVLVVGGDALGLEVLVANVSSDRLRGSQNLQLGTGTVQDDGVKAETVQEGEREREVVKLVGKDSTANPDSQCRRRPGANRATHLRTANLASGRTPPEAPLDDDVKIRRYRSTSCLEPSE